MSNDFDTVIIGGGHNGLVTAATLAQAGQRVLLLEQREALGGIAATEEIAPGYKVNTVLSNAGLFRPEIIEALNLEHHGLSVIDSPVTAFAPQADGTALTLWRDVEKSQAEIARFSETDADRFPTFTEAVSYLTDKLDGMMLRTPPSLADEGLADFLPWFADSLDQPRPDKRFLTDLVRVLPLSAVDFLSEWFESEALKGLLGSAAITGNLQGPYAPWTTFHLLYHYLGGELTGFKASRFVRGGIGQLSAVLARVANAYGAEIRTRTQAEQILVEGGRAIGVALAGGETISAKVVVSSIDPRRTFFDLIGALNLEVRFVRKLQNLRYRGCTAKVNLALSGLPEFSGQSQASQLGGHILISPSLDYLEWAFDAAKYGRVSPHPYVEAVIPTVLDSSLAPSGQHTMSITMQYAPYHLREGNWDDERERLGDRVIETLALFAPKLPDLILHRQTLTPLDLERTYGLTEGSIHHAEMGMDQMLFMRPVAGFGQYRTPIENLYLCGAGTHPGGGITGAPGFNAAREILRD